ncbi:putative glycosyl transferase [Enterococcus florum]|uniref:Putative glycosyl transferase n=1 Tax=Enterococcus florum TaxID=2480627 RepID=A0A4P5P7V6_9ENTE|nr:glycosyltransferase family 2 protein [Enterococcus florum]GCF93920.1 putative glycosyl transferase [Enterococcus florum]
MNELNPLLIIPAYNEEESLSSVILELREFQPELDFIIVNDGSSDNTVEVAVSMNANILDLPVNLGLSGAFEAGVKYAKQKGYDCVIQFDADGQHMASSIPSMILEAQKGADIVIGSRFLKTKKNRSLRMMGSDLIALAIRLTTGVNLTDPTSGLRLYNKSAIDAYLSVPNMTPEPDTMSFYIKSNAQIKEVQVNMRERLAGDSYLTVSRSIRYMLRMTISILILQFFRKKLDLTKMNRMAVGK